MILATNTIKAINAALELDQGAKFRGLFKEALSEISDAFNPEEEVTPRKHLGASIIGRECARAIWYGFHWVSRKRHEGRIVRLFHRGHLEEARFIALLRCAGMTTQHQQVVEGVAKQFKISGCQGHYGGSLDGIVYGCPDIGNEWALTEFKTHGQKSFDKLTKEGVEASKPEHAIQMRQYIAKMGLRAGLYLAICKNDDALHGEILMADPNDAKLYEERAERIITSEFPPPKLSNDIFFYKCKFCDDRAVCHGEVLPLPTCRTCDKADICDNGEWKCQLTGKALTAIEQFAGCGSHKYGWGLA